MNSKGQMFSLDLIIAISFVVLAIGLLYQQAELFHYYEKDNALQSELYRIGYNASNQLVGNPDVICPLTTQTGGTIIDYLPNCLPSSGVTKDAITKASLGIPDDYDCSITPSISNYCLSSNLPGDASNVFSIDRNVVILNSGDSITKAQFEDCINSAVNCALEETTINLKVWK